MLDSRMLIVGLGAATPIGRSALASAAAARAGVCGFAEHPYMVDSAGEPMRVAPAPWLDAGVEGAERLGELLIPVLDQALAPLAGDATDSPPPVGLALGLPPRRPGRPPEVADDIQQDLNVRYGERVSEIAVFEVGHAAGHLALRAAVSACASRPSRPWVVAGVDSYLAAETLEWLEECDQLHGAGRLNNAWGFIPGEAAGAVLIASREYVERRALQPIGEIVGIGIDRETRLIKTDAVCLGEGLTAAFRTALAALPTGARIDNVFCDLNGETYRADEYGFTALRTKEWFRSATDFIAPADCWGDIGAAGGPLHITLALISHRKGYGHGPLSMVWGSSEGGERGAVVVRDMGPHAE